MKLELIKDVKPNGDIFYSVKKDGLYTEGTIVYAGSIIEGEKAGAYERAKGLYELCKVVDNSNKIGETVILSEEIFGNNEKS